MHSTIPMMALLILGLHSDAAFGQASAPLSQTPSESNASDSVLTRQTSVVVVPALVRSKAGAMVYTLQADDFVLTDDGVAQKLTLEQETGGEPLALVVVIEV